MKAVVKTVEPADREARFDHIRPHYLEALTLVERLHRRLLDVIKDEFDRRGRADINSVQALLLYNIGDKELTAGELRTRGYYLGSNVSYNLKKLVEMGFLDHQRSRVDRRSVRIKLTEKGREVRDIVDALYTSTCARWSRSAASMPTSSASSTRRCTGSSASGPIKFCTGSKGQAHFARFLLVLACLGPGSNAGAFLPCAIGPWNYFGKRALSRTDVTELFAKEGLCGGPYSFDHYPRPAVWRRRRLLGL